MARDDSSFDIRWPAGCVVDKKGQVLPLVKRFFRRWDSGGTKDKAAHGK